MPQQLPEIAGPLQKAGLKLSPEQLSNLTGDPMGAVVALGGCTASFVSPQGPGGHQPPLRLRCDPAEFDRREEPDQDGFNAPKHSDELSAGPNARVYVLDQITDVTAQAAAIAAATTRWPAAVRWTPSTRPRSPRVKPRTASAAACTPSPAATPTDCSATWKSGRAPGLRAPGSVGKYGGDVDNWMWPRHTGDFSFYRAYVGRTASRPHSRPTTCRTSPSTS